MFLLFVFLLLFSFFGGGFLIYKPELLSLYFNRTISRKQIIVGFVIYLIVFLPTMVFIASTEGVSLPNSTSNVSKTASTLQTPTAVPTILVSHGLNISRSSIMAAIQQQNPSVSFLPGTPSDGQQVYTATQYKNVMTLIGPANNLIEITSTEPFDSIANDNLETIIFILGQIRLVDPSIAEWIGSTVQAANASITSGQTSFSRTYVLHQRQYVFTIENNSATLTIKPLSD